MRLHPIVRGPARHGFTVIELLLSVAIMTVIIIALYTVFDQTQKALRTTMAQVDVLESIRSSSDLMTRDLESATPVNIARTNDASFAVAVNPLSVPIEVKGLTGTGETLLRTTLQDVYFATRQNDSWTALGYWVGPINTNAVAAQTLSVGRLYRFSYETTAANFRLTNLFSRFNSQFRLASSAPVMDGVVHLRLVAYDRESKPLVPGIYTFTNNTPLNLRPWFIDPLRDTETAYWFRQFTVPSFPSALELEVGILEPQMVTRFASIPSPTEAAKFLSRNAGKIHLFRQRIPLRNAPTR